MTVNYNIVGTQIVGKSNNSGAFFIFKRCFPKSFKAGRQSKRYEEYEYDSVLLQLSTRYDQ